MNNLNLYSLNNLGINKKIEETYPDFCATSLYTIRHAWASLLSPVKHRNLPKLKEVKRFKNITLCTVFSEIFHFVLLEGWEG